MDKSNEKYYDSEMAYGLEQMGNEAFDSKDFESTLDFYDQGLILTPPDDFDRLSRLYYNKGRCYEYLM